MQSYNFFFFFLKTLLLNLQLLHTPPPPKKKNLLIILPTSHIDLIQNHSKIEVSNSYVSFTLFYVVLDFISF